MPIGHLISDIRLAVRNILRNRQRSVVAVSTVALGIVAFLLAGGFIEFIFQDLRETTIHSQLGHLQITRPGYFERGIADPYSFLLPGGGLRIKSVYSGRPVSPAWRHVWRLAASSAFAKQRWRLLAKELIPSGKKG